MAICAKFLGHTSSMHPLAIASPTTTIVEPLVACIIVFYDLIQKSAPIPKYLERGRLHVHVVTFNRTPIKHVGM